MRKSIAVFIIFLITMPIALFGQSYTALWKKVKEAEDKDLPKTQYEVLQQIAKKAAQDKAYGQLLKAELQGAQVMASMAPDSLKPAMERMAQRGEVAKDMVLKTVCQTVVYKVAIENGSLELSPKKPFLDEALCGQLAQVKDKTYSPVVVEGADSKVFDHDMLSVIGYELEEFAPLHAYYNKVGNRQAACLTAADAWQQNHLGESGASYWQTLDSLMETYGDLEEAGNLAIHRYQASSYSMTAEEKLRYISMALGKWGGWKRMNILRNEEKRLTNPQYQVKYECAVNLPMQPMKIGLEQLRNISSLKLTVYRVNATGEIEHRPNNAEGYRKIKSLLSQPIAQQERRFLGKKDFELFEDSLTLEGLPVGVYMLEFSTNPSTEVIRHLYFVTDVYTLSESLPQGRIRYAVVSATTGQPMAGASLHLKQYTSYNKFTVIEAKTDAKGEYIYDNPKGRRTQVFAFTAQDKACPDVNTSNQYRYYANENKVQQTQIYTDRAIYRPGQQVHVAAIVYDVTNGYQHQATEGKAIAFTLRDANWKVIKEEKGTTDAYGMCVADFALPSSVLTGHFTIQANGQSHSIRVEEYKRPTFQVEFPEVKQHYEAGDTVRVRATARSYAGVPVQGARVSYRVVRRMAFWWWNYWRYYDGGLFGTAHDDTEVMNGETVTDSDGTFLVDMPMMLPESEHPLFYNFIVTADVTDVAGETHCGQLSLPLGNRKTALSIDLAEQILAESHPTMTFHLRNAAGQDIDTIVKYRIDNGQWQTVKSDLSCAIQKAALKSGRHTVEATCEGDSVKRSFVVFSLDDQKPATETDDWFYQSATQFPNNGKPVTVQVGSSDADMHIFYSVFSGEKLLETGAVDKSNALINRKFIYKESYGNGIVVNFAWVKHGKCHTHTAEIRRPLPDKQLQLQWSTFRDRLTPGQQEEWTLTVKQPDGKSADAMLMATLYDKSLDQLAQHQWGLSPYTWLPLPNAGWQYPWRNEVSAFGQLGWISFTERELELSQFDKSIFPSRYHRLMVRGSRMMKSAVAMESVAMAPALNDAAYEEVVVAGYAAKGPAAQEAEDEDMGEGGADAQEEVQMRENLNETAFFYPQLTTDKEGKVALRFTLPESLTTWRFMGLAHTKDMCYGLLEGEAVAKKEVMVQPNMPRFVREGDEATITARILNTSEKDVEGIAMLSLVDPLTDKVVMEKRTMFALGPQATTTASFDVSPLTSGSALFICRVSVLGNGFSDGEQHYLPVLPNTERVTVTLPFTQNEPGTKTLDLSAQIPSDATNGKLTLEYTGNPAWLMVQALPTVGKPIDDNAISLAASYYANSLGQYIVDQNPKIKTVYELWQQEQGQETSLMSAFEKNQKLKDIVLNETPWVMDADREQEQKQRLADFFDDNLMKNRLASSLEKMKALQHGDGGWSWWLGMPGSFYMTVAVSEMLVRLNALTGNNTIGTRVLLDNAFRFMGNEVVEEVKEMKKQEKKGVRQVFPSLKMLQWLYLCTLDGRTLPADVQQANAYLLPLLKKDIKKQSIYEKALTAVILSKSDPVRAKEYVKSLKEYTVYREEMGRYYDTPRAGYSWFDYKIPTQTMAIEALQRITPADQQTVLEMQRWLLQSKRTQAWDTPLNSVNAIFAFLFGDDKLRLSGEATSVIKVDGQPVELPKATAALDYVKTLLPDADSKTLIVDKSSEGTSWGIVYAQFMQPMKSIENSGSSITVKRELVSANNEPFTVGDRITVRLIIETDRDLDFVQVLDKRAACMEPVRQLSGYQSGSYCTPRDNTTNYYFHMLSKGRHVIETDYFIDRPGTYETGTCTVQCAYAPEFRATAKSQTIIVK